MRAWILVLLASAAAPHGPVDGIRFRLLNEALTQADFVRILTEPENALTRQYVALLETERVGLHFQDDAVAEIARIAAEVNERTENIGARRLHTVLERLLDQISFDAPEMGGQEIVVDAAMVRERLSAILEDQDLSRFIL